MMFFEINPNAETQIQTFFFLPIVYTTLSPWCDRQVVGNTLGLELLYGLDVRANRRVQAKKLLGGLAYTTHSTC